MIKTLLSQAPLRQTFTAHGSIAEAGEAGAAASDSRYCYMFPDLAEAEAQRQAQNCAAYFDSLNLLANEMDDQASDTHLGSALPAVYTYFGQFLNHDLSAPVATPRYRDAMQDRVKTNGHDAEVVLATPDAIALMSSQRVPGPWWLVDNILNQHPEPLALYSLYGSGPESPDSEIRALFDAATMKFRLGTTFDEPGLHRPSHELDKMLRHDLVRTKGIARIADRRNDENVILSQLHLAFMLFHNNAVDVLKAHGTPTSQLFAKARSLVTLHYRHCIMHDYLRHMVPDESLGAEVEIADGVPFEFTTAAFRFGHSMIAAKYDYNRFFGVRGLEGRLATLKDLFQFTSHGKMAGAVRGNGQLPTHWVIDWARLLNPANGAEPVDHILPNAMITMGDVSGADQMSHGLTSICHRNIKRGFHRFMPSGQQLAQKFSITPLTPQEIKGTFSSAAAQALLVDTGFDTHTPPWVYFLCEARVRRQGPALGPTAGAIVRGTIMALLKRSVLTSDNDQWTPEQSPLRLADGSPVKDIKGFLQFAGVLGQATPVA